MKVTEYDEKKVRRGMMKQRTKLKRKEMSSRECTWFPIDSILSVRWKSV